MTELNASGEVVEKRIFDVTDGVLRIPEGEEYILEESYHGREDIEEIFLPSSMKVIGPIAFAECPGIRKVHLNDGLEEIGDGAFLGAALLTEIKLPESLRTIGPMAFWSCGLAEIDIPASVEFIGESAFWDCPELMRANVHNPDAIIEQDAFGDCPQLVQGYMAPGFPQDDYRPSNLLFAMLWASTYEQHKGRPETAERAKEFITDNRKLILENILRTNNTSAMRAIIDLGLFDIETIEDGLKAAVEAGYTELATLFLSAKGRMNAIAKNTELDEFEL